jgi:protein-disulfide isomerase
MTRRAAATFLVCGLLAGCVGDAGREPDDDTTARLLAQPVGDGMSTPVPADPSGTGTAAEIDLAQLGFDHGRSEAIVKVVELSDFGCGFCKRFHDETFPTLREEFIETGKVEWKFLPYVTGMFANSLAVTTAAECVMEQDAVAYETLTRRMWAEQSTWKGSDQPAPLLRSWASELGVDVPRYDACLVQERRLARVTAATALARQIGVRGTPTFIIIGYPPLQGALPLEVFQQILTAVHAEETRLGEVSPEGATGR